MKKTLKIFLTVLLAVTAAVCTVAGLSACGGSKLESITVENARTDFKVGDEFVLGEDFTVTAHYSDGKTVDVTDEAKITQEKGFDMSVAGDYMITVGYGGKKVVYTVYVGSFDNILRKIELDTAAVKKDYKLGEEISYSGLKLKCTYENAQGQLVERVTEDLKNFKLEIKDSSGNISGTVFSALDDYVVTVSQGAVQASYTVKVAGVDVSTVQGAIAVGSAFKSEVVSGSQTVWSAKKGGDIKDGVKIFDYDYKFGDNYTYVKEDASTPVKDEATNEILRYVVYEYHYSMESDGIFGVQLQDGKTVANNQLSADAMGGSPNFLWYSSDTQYGIENTLASLYKHAKVCSNGDLKETADEQNRKYSFSFSGLEFRSNNADYYETTVTFTLGEKYNVEHVEFTQDYYENNDSAAGADWYTPSFVTVNGITTPASPYTQRNFTVVDQSVGERTENMPYSPDMFKLKSYKLMHYDVDLGDNGEIECDVKNPSLTINIEDIMPSTADFTHDPMYLDYEGNHSGEVNSSSVLVSTGFTAYRSGNVLKIKLKNGGVWKLKIRTSLTAKTITFNVKGVDPTQMVSQIGNPVTGKFGNGDKKTVAIGGDVYFRGAVNEYANADQKAEVTSSNSSSATVEQVTLGGVKCFKFKAAAAGTYNVTVTSLSGSPIRCLFTFTVSDLPDFESLLGGEYTTVDEREGNIFNLVFTPSSAGEGVSGTVKITVTPTNEDGTLLPEQAKTQTLNFSVDTDGVSIVLTHVSGENLGIDLFVDDAGQLLLEDRYGRTFPLTRVQP